MVSRLNDGDVIIEIEEVITSNKTERLKSKICSSAEHGMIYGNSKLYHSSQGNQQGGVRSHSVEHIFHNKCTLGEKLVFRIKNEEIRKNLISIVTQWDPTRDAKIYEEAKKNKKSGRIILPTPFVNYRYRKKDVGNSEEISQFELFRVFRAYTRNKEDKPLSKKKGVSCGNFVSYSIKAAIIQTLFPKGLPEAIREKYHFIEKKKTDTNRKLSNISLDEFKEFQDIVLKNLPNDQKEMGNIPLIELYNELCRAVKGYSIEEFCRHAFDHPAIWDFSGYVFYRDSSMKETWVMPHDIYLKFFKTFGRDHNMIVDDDELNAIGISLENLNESKQINKK